MEVHHHAHTARKKWTHYIWEFLMLFLAVFCGFLAENFREHKVENHRAREFASSMVKDLGQDTANLAAYKKTVNRYIRLSDTLLELSRQKLDGPAAARFSFYARFAYWTGGVTWSRTTFDQIKSSGSMRYFDHGLVEKLLRYDGLINDIQMEYRNHDTRGNMLVNSINKIIDPHLHQEVSRLYLWSLDTISSKTIEAFCKWQVASLETKRPEIQELLNMVVVQQRNLRVRQDLRDQAAALATELIGDFRSAYHLK